MRYGLACTQQQLRRFPEFELQPGASGIPPAVDPATPATHPAAQVLQTCHTHHPPHQATINAQANQIETPHRLPAHSPHLPHTPSSGCLPPRVAWPVSTVPHDSGACTTCHGSLAAYPRRGGLAVAFWRPTIPTSLWPAWSLWLPLPAHSSCCWLARQRSSCSWEQANCTCRQTYHSHNAPSTG